MTEPIVFICRHKIKAGKNEGLRKQIKTVFRLYWRPKQVH